MEYPIRINKYLASQKICSRREADELIKMGLVKINGVNAKLGDLVNEGDKVNVSNNKQNFYYVFNKPRGVVTHSPQKGETSIFDIINFPHRVYPLGRLDKESTGLILFTNDGRVTDKLLNPEYEHEKEYYVRVNKPITRDFVVRMSSGVKLDDGYKTKPCIVKMLDNFSFRIILTEGKNRQIRRMCSSLNYVVQDLNRVRIMNIRLNDLGVGRYKSLSGGELKEFLRLLGL